MMQVKEAIVVEGRYDKERLAGIVEGIVVETRGFRIFKDEKQRAYIKKLAAERGILILTDSDSAGFLIRNHLKSFVPEAQIKNAYIPKTLGKEKRKRAPSKEGLLGVEGQDATAILQAIKNAGGEEEALGVPCFTVADLYQLGLTGTENSSAKRRLLLQKLDLPNYLSTKDLLRYMNRNWQAVAPLIEKQVHGKV